MNQPKPPPHSDTDRRSGTGRRHEETGPPSSFERRRSIESRKPDVTELELSPEELDAFDFSPAPKKTTP